ncbi:MAG: type I pullulanase [Culicoidibacterales bacterium]
MEQLFRAYWDDQNSITIDVPHSLLRERGDFYLQYEKQFIALEATKVIRGLENDTFLLELPLKLTVGSVIEIMDCDQNRIELEPRNIVRQQWFDDEFYYEGTDLGADFSVEETAFSVWAPTATEVALRVKQCGRSERMQSMQRTKKGVYRTTVYDNLEDAQYAYLVKIGGRWKEAIDPYGHASFANAKYSAIINPRSVEVNLHENMVSGWYDQTDAIIYELHVRDFTIDPQANFTQKGSYHAFIEQGKLSNAGNPIGIDYLEKLGVTHVQLLPIYDFGSVDEHGHLGLYNWGYDPVQYNTPEGSYSSNPDEPKTRIIELKELVSALHQRGIRCNMDVVYNHVYKIQQFSFEQIVPGYFSRHTDYTTLSNGSGCGNDTASERKMVRKFIVDSLVYWQTAFGFDGFRFDLMGLIDIETMQQIEQILRADKKTTMLYGEGWDMPTAYPSKKLAHMGNAHCLGGIGFFNSEFRDDIKGSTFEVMNLGIVNGNVARANNLQRLLKASSSTKHGQNLFSYPGQSINYVSCHDNYTLFDKMLYTSLNSGLEVVQAQHRLALSFVLVAQGVAFLHGGSEFYRTKKGIENSYNRQDDINLFDWGRMDDNKSTVDYVSGLIAIRKMHKAFRFAGNEEIKKHVSVDIRGNIVEYDLLHVGEYGPYDEIKIVFNLGKAETEYYFNGEYNCFAHNRSASSSPLFKSDMLTILPYTMAIMMR